MLSAQASAFVASAPHPESSMREQLLHIVGACRIRHAHMPGISPVAFASGLAVESDKLATVGREIERRLEVANELTSESGDGTKISITFPKNRRWVSRLGHVGAGEAVIFPAGSLIACPENVAGTFAATSVGEFFGAREGLLREALLFEIDGGRVVKVTAPNNPHLVRDVEAMLKVAPNSDRVGLVVIGVNDGVGEPTGDINVDQHRPGLHLVFGDPMPKLTGASWSARTSFCACQAQGAVHVDGTLVIDRGRLV
jgi:leucyl aminopeptidase (aminopeptidase T)